MAGVVSGVRIRMTARGKMAIVTIDDAVSKVDVVVGNDLLNSHQHLLKEDALIIVEGRVSNDDFSGGLRVNARKLYDLAGARNQYASLLKIACNGQSDALKLNKMLSPFVNGNSPDGGCKVKVEYHNAHSKVEVMLGDAWRVELRDELLDGLKTWLSPDNVKVLYS